jgi:hypothetical protein
MSSRENWIPLMLLLLLVGARPAGAQASMQPAATITDRIRILCHPGWMVLGVDREVELRIELDPEAKDLELFASRGEVGAVTQVAPGIFRATYAPPRQTYPQVAIIAAVAMGVRGPITGWEVLPLWGQGVAEVPARPGASVTLRVGTRKYGPVVADERGVARVAVEVPPGVHEAWLGRRRIDLGVPPLPLAQAIVERRVLRADLEETVGVRIYTVTPEGRPRRGVAFSLTASRGRVEAPVDVGPGVFLARWSVPPGQAGPLELTGKVRGEGNKPFQVQVEAVPGPAQHFELRVDREELVADEEARVAVEVTARDGVGNPARAALRLESSFGKGGALEERQVGVYAGVIEVAPAFGGRDRLELRLFADGGKTPALTRTVALRPAAPARIRVEPLQPRLMGDGRAEAAWGISVEDRFGNRVPGPAPVISRASEGPGVLLTREPGVYEVRYVPPLARVDREEAIEARVGEVHGRGGLRLLHRDSLLNVAVRTGVVTNFADVVAPSFGLQVELWPKVPLRGMGLLIDAGYLRFTREGGAAVPGFLGRNEMVGGTAALALRARWGRWVDTWAAAGPSVTRVRSQVRWGERPALEEGTWVLGAQALVGVGVPVGPGSPFLEARVCWFDDPSLHVLRGALRGGGFNVGYRLELL